MSSNLIYSNPRIRAEIDNWPMGGSRRGVAVFSIEAKPGKGERAIRTTRQDGSSKATAPKTLTFSTRARIVDGNDGKTYVASLTTYGHVSVFQSNMQFEQESIFPGDLRYPAIRALFD